MPLRGPTERMDRPDFLRLRAQDLDMRGAACAGDGSAWAWLAETER